MQPTNGLPLCTGFARTLSAPRRCGRGRGPVSRAVRGTDILSRGQKMMTSIIVFVIAVGVGCLTGAIVGVLLRHRQAGVSPGKPPFWALPTDD